MSALVRARASRPWLGHARVAPRLARCLSSLSNVGTVISSPFPSVTAPETSLTEFILRGIEQHGEAVSIVDGPSGRAIRGDELRPLITNFAAGLVATTGLAKRGVMAILSPNAPEYFVAFHGCSSFGGVVTTLNPLYTPHEISSQLNDSKASVIVTTKALSDKAQEAAVMSGVQHIIILDEADEDGSRDGVAHHSYSSVLAAGSAAGPLPAASIEPTDLVVLPYSSGTSGKSKGVVLTHSNLITNILQLDELGAAGPGDACLGLLPFFHIYGMVVVLNWALRSGCTVHTMPSFDPALFLKLLPQLSVMHIAPPVASFLAKHPAVEEVLPLQKLRDIICAAAPLGGELALATKQRLGGSCAIRQGYGLTETSPAAIIAPPDVPDSRLDSVGKLLPNMRAKIVDAEGQICPPGTAGEIALAGPNIMQGYLELPEATAACLRDGWFFTGDVGYVDEDGWFYIVDRVKELIKVKGFQVAPAELEDLLVACPGIADAAVIGVPDERAGEVPKAFVVRQAAGDEAVDVEHVLAHCRSRVAEFKVPAYIEFVDAVPKSASGKILRRELRDLERERSAAAGS